MAKRRRTIIIKNMAIWRAANIEPMITFRRQKRFGWYGHGLLIIYFKTHYNFLSLMYSHFTSAYLRVGAYVLTAMLFKAHWWAYDKINESVKYATHIYNFNVIRVLTGRYTVYRSR